MATKSNQSNNFYDSYVKFCNDVLEMYRLNSLLINNNTALCLKYRLSKGKAVIDYFGKHPKQVQDLDAMISELDMVSKDIDIITKSLKTEKLKKKISMNEYIDFSKLTMEDLKVIREETSKKTKKATMMLSDLNLKILDFMLRSFSKQNKIVRDKNTLSYKQKTATKTSTKKTATKTTPAKTTSSKTKAKG